MSKADEIKYSILRKYVNEINKMYKCGCWIDWISAEKMAKLMNISIYSVRKAFKELSKEGYLKLDKVPTEFQEYNNGLYCESIPYLFCKAYVLTDSAYKKAKEFGWIGGGEDE